MASKLVFCDLAACEPTRSGHGAARGGKAAAEAAHVSKSLLALGNVISAATNPRRNSGYVPYRDSLLTRVLQVRIACSIPSSLLVSFWLSRNVLPIGPKPSADSSRPAAENDAPTTVEARDQKMTRPPLPSPKLRQKQCYSVRVRAAISSSDSEARQDCPGKATHTVLLTCVSAADICHEATLQTLRFAERARSRNLPGAAACCVGLVGPPAIPVHRLCTK